MAAADTARETSHLIEPHGGVLIDRTVTGSEAAELAEQAAGLPSVRLTEKQKKLLRDLENSLKEGGAKHSPQARSFMERMKGFFATE